MNYDFRNRNDKLKMYVVLNFDFRNRKDKLKELNFDFRNQNDNLKMEYEMKYENDNIEDITSKEILIYLCKKYLNQSFKNDIDFSIVNDGRKGIKQEHIYLQIILLNGYVEAIEEYKVIHKFLMKNLDENKIEKLYQICKESLKMITNPLNEFKKLYKIDEAEIKYLCLLSLGNECKNL